MANNIVEFIIKIKENAKKQTEGVNQAFKKANENARKLAEASQKLPLTIADYRGELAALEHKKTFAKSEAEILKLNGTIAKTQKGLQRLENLPPNGFISRLKKAATAMTGLRLGDLGMAYLGVQVKRQISESIKLFDVQKKAEAQLRASLESTGYVAGRTFSQLTQQAAELQKKTIFGDENIIKAQSLMLTFKNVRGLIFDKAMPAVLDLATKMGGDLQGAVVQVGKALQDPIMGVTALRRVGIQFTKEQEDALKSLVEAGRTEEAQLIILNELQSQFGGSAEAAASAGLGPLQQLTNAWNDFRERVGGTALKVSNTVIPALKNTVEWMDRNGTALKNLVKTAAIATVAYLSFKIAQLSTIKVMALFKATVVAKNAVMILLTGGLKQARIAMLAFNAATKANIIGLVVAAVTTAITAFSAFRKKTDEAAKAKKRATEIGQEYYVKEKSWLEQHFQKLEKTNAKSKERIRLVDELLKRYPTLNKELRDELENTTNINEQKSILIAHLQQEAIAEGMKGALKEKADAYAKAELLAVQEEMENNAIIDAYGRDRFNREQQYYKDAVSGKISVSMYDDVLGSFFNISGKLKHSAQRMRDQEKTELDKLQEALLLNKVVLFPPGRGSGTSLFSNGLEPGSGISAESIASGGKSVKNFNITINDGLINGVQNYFNSSSDNPESAGDFLWRLSQALQMILNDVNYAGG